MKILVVDDSKTLRLVLSKTLNEFGYKDIEQATSAEEAEESIASASFDLILSDIHLGERSGINLLRSVRASVQNATVAFIVLSSDRNEKVTKEADAAGADGYLYKPFNKGELKKAIQKLIDSERIICDDGDAKDDGKPLVDPSHLKTLASKITRDKNMTMTTLEVGDMKCEFYAGYKNAIFFPQKIKERFPNGNFFLVTDSNLAKKHGEVIKKWEKDLDFTRIQLLNGKESKSIDEWTTLTSTLIDKKAGHNLVLIGFGGPSVLEVTAFAASLYLGGISCVFVPTTWHGIMDTSFRGNAGIIVQGQADIISANCCPAIIWTDLLFLETLAESSYAFGYPEILRYAFIAGAEAFTIMESIDEDIANKNSDMLPEIIAHCLLARGLLANGFIRQQRGKQFFDIPEILASSIKKQDTEDMIESGDALTLGIELAWKLSINFGTVPEKARPIYNSLFSKLPKSLMPDTLDPDKVATEFLSRIPTRGLSCSLLMPNGIGTSDFNNDIPTGLVTKEIRNLFGQDKD